MNLNKRPLYESDAKKVVADIEEILGQKPEDDEIPVRGRGTFVPVHRFNNGLGQKVEVKVFSHDILRSGGGTGWVVQLVCYNGDVKSFARAIGDKSVIDRVLRELKKYARGWGRPTVLA